MDLGKNMKNIAAMFPARIKLVTFRVLGELNNHYTAETTKPCLTAGYDGKFDL